MAGKAKKAAPTRKDQAAMTIATPQAIVAPTPKAPKKKKDERLSRAEEVALLKARINKQFEGKGAIQSGEEFTNVFTLRRPTGITDLDLALAGGPPAGGLTQIIGEDGAGKSYLVNRIMANVQETYGQDSTISVCMTEMPYDKIFAKWKCGVQVAFSDQEIEMLEQANIARGLPPFDAQALTWLRHQIGTFQQAIFATAEQLLEAAVQQVESNLYQVVLIDSFGALLTKAEAEAEEGLEGKHYGGASGVITQFMHRLHAALNLPDKYGRPNTTTLIGINQYRENLKATGMYANPLQIAGGRALKHGKLVDLLLEKGSRLWVGPDGKKVPVGREVKWSIIKGKAGCHDGPTGTFKFYYGDYGYGFGADVYHNLLMAGVKSGVIEQNGAWYSYKNENICQGADNSADFFMNARVSTNGPLVMDEIRKEIFKTANIRYITKETF